MKAWPVTVNHYPYGPEYSYYIYTVQCGRNCAVCRHLAARRDLRKDKRYVVLLDPWRCQLFEQKRISPIKFPPLDGCEKFALIDELRAKNMTPLEKLYARKYTRKYYRDVLKWYYGVSGIKLSWRKYLFCGEFANIILRYERHRYSRNNWK